jgi:hypothetical protein
MASTSATDYGPTINELIRLAPENPLDAGVPDATIRSRLNALTDAAIRPGAHNADMAAACRAGLWLRFNYLDEAHQISQNLGTPEGSFWHGIVHRREGDFDNAKYWFRRVGTHPVYALLRQAAANLAKSGNAVPIETLIGQSVWDPFAFVDLCAKAIRAGDQSTFLCQEVQRLEWELLFDYCWNAAGG